MRTYLGSRLPSSVHPRPSHAISEDGSRAVEAIYVTGPRAEMSSVFPAPAFEAESIGWYVVPGVSPAAVEADSRDRRSREEKEWRGEKERRTRVARHLWNLVSGSCREMKLYLMQIAFGGSFHKMFTEQERGIRSKSIAGCGAEVLNAEGALCWARCAG